MSGARRLLPVLVVGCAGLVGCASSPRVGCYQAPCDNCPPAGRVVPVPTVLPEGNFIQPQRNTFDPSYRPAPPPQSPVPQFQPLPSAGDQQATLRPPSGDPNARATPDVGGTPLPDIRIEKAPTPPEPPAQPAPLPGMPPAAEPLPTTDIPGVALVRPGLLSGQQPFPDGIRWLSQHGYRTVLHLRLPEEQDTAAQRVFEKQNLRYVDLRVSPQTLSPEAVEAFNRQVADPALRPLFVYERRDSGLVGMMWYLNGRTAQHLSEERALAEASRLGFRPESDASHRTALDAANAYLRDHNP